MSRPSSRGSRKQPLSALTGRATATPRVARTVTSISIPVVQERISQVLSALLDSKGNPLLTETQIDQLEGITLQPTSNNPKGQKFFTLEPDARDEVYQIISLIETYGFDEILKSLQSKKWENRRQYFFEGSPAMTFSRYKSAIDIDIYRNKIDVAKGAFKCKCGSEETIYAEKQVRSADEPMTIKVKCIHCGNQWTQ